MSNQTKYIIRFHPRADGVSTGYLSISGGNFTTMPADFGAVKFGETSYIGGFTLVLGYLPDDIFMNTRVIMPRPVILVAKEA